MERTMRGAELAVVVAAEVHGERDQWTLEASLEELTALAESAGVMVVGRATQRLEQPNPATYIGSGKVEEVRDAVADLGADVVLFDRELSPRQQRNLERELKVKVIDRTALILDVFAQHARTKEGMLQVELAQWEYRLPRLTRMWTHLARQAGGRAGGASGGVGVRGPGETQIELDRREIRRRIAALQREIETLRSQRRQSRRHRRRSGMPAVSLVGYTNAGKSTVLNAVSDADVYTADQLFATLDPTTRRVDLPSGRTVLLSDTVGFIQKLPTQLVAAFRATLEEITEADLLLHVVDVTHPDAAQQAEIVERILRDLGMVDPPMVVAANKCDLLVVVDDAVPEEITRLREMYPELVPVSARTGDGLHELLTSIDGELSERLLAIEVVIPYKDGSILNLVHTHGAVEDETFEPDGTRLKARVPAYLVGALADFAVVDGEPKPPAAPSGEDTS